MIGIKRGALSISGVYGSNYARGKRGFELTTDDMTDVVLDMNLVGFVLACVAHENGIKGKAVDRLLDACRYEPSPPPSPPRDPLTGRMLNLVARLSVNHYRFAEETKALRREARAIMREIASERRTKKDGRKP